jgi:hypothetical protein
LEVVTPTFQEILLPNCKFGANVYNVLRFPTEEDVCPYIWPVFIVPIVVFVANKFTEDAFVSVPVEHVSDVIPLVAKFVTLRLVMLAFVVNKLIELVFAAAKLLELKNRPVTKPFPFTVNIFEIGAPYTPIETEFKLDPDAT